MTRPADPRERAQAALDRYDEYVKEMSRTLELKPFGYLGAMSDALRALLAEAPRVEPPPRARIICLCGSTRFIEQFAIKTWELEREGHIVLGCTLLPSWYCDAPSHFGERTGTKAQCDELHLRKIDLADDVLVLNIGGYIGESTRNEIAYATRHGKPVTYLEAPVPAAGEEP